MIKHEHMTCGARVATSSLDITEGKLYLFSFLSLIGNSRNLSLVTELVIQIG